MKLQNGVYLLIDNELRKVKDYNKEPVSLTQRHLNPGDKINMQLNGSNTSKKK